MLMGLQPPNCQNSKYHIKSSQKMSPSRHTRYDFVNSPAVTPTSTAFQRGQISLDKLCYQVRAKPKLIDSKPLCNEKQSHNSSAESKAQSQYLLNRMEEIDTNIQTLEQKIAKLENKKATLLSDLQEPKAVDVPKDLSLSGDLAHQILSSNQSKAEQSHKKMDCLGEQYDVPLYMQPADCAIHNNPPSEKTRLFRAHLIANIKKAKKIITEKEEQMSEAYDRNYEQWIKKVESQKNSAKRRAKHAKMRESFEKIFPELKKQRENHERGPVANSRGIARSEAEYAEIVASLQEEVNSGQQISRLAVVTPMITQNNERKYINNNGLVKDPVALNKQYNTTAYWTEEDKKYFVEKHYQYPKNFAMISHCIGKDISECIRYYYLIKHKENLKNNTKKNMALKKRTGKIKPSRVPTPLPADESSNSSLPPCELEKTEVSSFDVSSIEQKLLVKEEFTSESDSLTRNGSPAHPIQVQPGIVCENCGSRMEEVTSINSDSQFRTLCHKCKEIANNNVYTTCPIFNCNRHIEDDHRLKNLMISWSTISQEMSTNLRENFGVHNGATKACSSCYTKIVSLLKPEQLKGNVADFSFSQEDAGTWTEREESELTSGLTTVGCNWEKLSSIISSKSSEQCKKFYFANRKRLSLDDCVLAWKKNKRKRQHRNDDSQKELNQENDDDTDTAQSESGDTISTGGTDVEDNDKPSHVNDSLDSNLVNCTKFTNAIHEPKYDKTTKSIEHNENDVRFGNESKCEDIQKPMPDIISGCGGRPSTRPPPPLLIPSTVARPSSAGSAASKPSPITHLLSGSISQGIPVGYSKMGNVPDVRKDPATYHRHKTLDYTSVHPKHEGSITKGTPLIESSHSSQDISESSRATLRADYLTSQQMMHPDHHHHGGVVKQPERRPNIASHEKLLQMAYHNNPSALANFPPSSIVYFPNQTGAKSDGLFPYLPPTALPGLGAANIPSVSSATLNPSAFPLPTSLHQSTELRRGVSPHYSNPLVNIYDHERGGLQNATATSDYEFRKIPPLFYQIYDPQKFPFLDVDKVRHGAELTSTNYDRSLSKHAQDIVQEKDKQRSNPTSLDPASHNRLPNFQDRNFKNDICRLRMDNGLMGPSTNHSISSPGVHPNHNISQLPNESEIRKRSILNPVCIDDISAKQPRLIEDNTSNATSNDVKSTFSAIVDQCITSNKSEENSNQEKKTRHHGKGSSESTFKEKSSYQFQHPKTNGDKFHHYRPPPMLNNYKNKKKENCLAKPSNTERNGANLATSHSLENRKPTDSLTSGGITDQTFPDEILINRYNGTSRVNNQSSSSHTPVSNG